MQKKANLIALAAFFAGLAAFQMYAKRLQAEARGGGPESVLIARKDLAPGTMLSEDNLGVVAIPADYLDPRRVRADEKQNLLGVALDERVQAGEGLVWSDLADGAAHKHLASLVSPGRRAYSLESSANPLGRLLRVADHVDVILEESGKTKTLLQRVLVLAVGGQTERSDEVLGSTSARASGVTLSVTAEEANQLLAAEARGNLRLVLRNPEDQRREAQLSQPAHAPSIPKAELAPPKEVIEHVH